jgi:hypothetical protein
MKRHTLSYPSILLVLLAPFAPRHLHRRRPAAELSVVWMQMHRLSSARDGARAGNNRTRAFGRGGGYPRRATGRGEQSNLRARRKSATAGSRG